MAIRSVPPERRLALLVAGCFFMEMLDGTIVTTAAPSIGRSLGVPSTSISLVISAYLVTLAVLIPASGWVAARWGARPVFLAAIAIFTVASLGCALSTAFAELVAFRVAQGAGGAMMVPVGRLVVLGRTEKSQLLTITSLLVWPALIA
ncbi:MAG TPA: MFS transporter, partial [Solirubrobacterales bacterium]